MFEDTPAGFAELYQRFHSPLAEFDCGDKCAPYNERGVPFCCDTRHAVPTAYEAEWTYLQSHTDLWHLWNPGEAREAVHLQKQIPPGQVLIECLGHRSCQRQFRSLTCRAFPFFPYTTRQGDFIGLSYYWDYEDCCWVISHLDIVTPEYRHQFMSAFDQLFERLPAEKEHFRYYSSTLRRVFSQRKRAIPLLHRNGDAYKISPGDGHLRKVPIERFPKFGVYHVADKLPFPDESS